MEAANIEWLEDTALRLLCVFALDRFGDYVSDEVCLFSSKHQLFCKGSDALVLASQKYMR